MGPKNGKRKRNKEEDDELDKKFKWLEMLQKKTAEASDEEIEEFVESKTFDFTGVKAYYE